MPWELVDQRLFLPDIVDQEPYPVIIEHYQLGDHRAERKITVGSLIRSEPTEIVVSDLHTGCKTELLQNTYEYLCSNSKESLMSKIFEVKQILEAAIKDAEFLKQPGVKLLR